MTNKTIKMILGAGCVAVGLFCACDAGAKDLFWGGASGTWKVGEGGWKLADGTPAVFEEGDNVTFGDAAGTVTVTASGKFGVGNLRIDASNKYIFKGGDNLTNVTSYVKSGTGEANFQGLRGSFDCDVQMIQGTMHNETTQMSGNGLFTPWGNMLVERKLIVGTGDANTVPTMKWAFANTIGQNNPVSIYTVPAYDCIANAGIIVGGYQSAGSVMGDITFKNGGMLQHLTAGGAAFPAINGRIMVKRSEENNNGIPAAIKASSIHAIRLGVATQEPTEIYVEEVTSGDGSDDGAADLVIDSPIKDYVPTAGSLYRSSWRKTGPGTLLFSGSEKPALLTGTAGYDSRDSDYTGDVFIDEGTVRVSLEFAWAVGNTSGLGKIRDIGRDRTVYVNEGAKLEFGPGNNYGILSYIEYPPAELTFAVSNALFLVKHMSHIGSVKLYGTGDLSYSAQIGLGALVHMERNEPYVFSAVGSTKNYLSALTDSENVPPPADSTDKQKKFGFTEFCIKEATENENNIADCTIDCVFKNANCHNNSKPSPYLTFAGIKKTGSGVLLVNKAQEFTHTNIVAEGGMYLNGSLVSNVFVKAGASFGGGGMVKGNLAIEEGGGLLVDAGNPSAQLTVNGSIALPESGIMMVYDYSGDLSQIGESVVGISLPNGLSTEGFDFSTWKVRVKGFTPRECRNLIVEKSDDNTLKIRSASAGFMVIVK